jgi:hypothetical protein
MGNLVVIECTTGILKEDSKLSHLFQRTEKVLSELHEKVPMITR